MIGGGGGQRDCAALGHGLGGVDYEVEENLLDLAFVGFDEERGGGAFEVEGDFALGEFEADEDEGVFDNVSEGPA